MITGTDFADRFRDLRVRAGLTKTAAAKPRYTVSFVSQIAAVPNVVSIHPSVPARNMVEFIAYARKNPGKLNFGTPGVGSLGHLIGETFKYSAKVNLTHVPYRGAGPALNDALGGHVLVGQVDVPGIGAGDTRRAQVGAQWHPGHRLDAARDDRHVVSVADDPSLRAVGAPRLTLQGGDDLVIQAHGERSGHASSCNMTMAEQQDNRRRLRRHFGARDVESSR